MGMPSIRAKRFLASRYGMGLRGPAATPQRQRQKEAKIHRMRSGWIKPEDLGERRLVDPCPRRSFSNESDEKRPEGAFRKAIAIARGQAAKSFELRAATSLARLLTCQTKARGGARPSRADLRLVHRRLRHRRSEGSEGTTQRVELSRASPCPPSGMDDRFQGDPTRSRG